MDSTSFLKNISFSSDFRHPDFDSLGLYYGFIPKSLSSGFYSTSSLIDPDSIIRPHQIHSDKTVYVSELLANPLVEADAIYTDQDEIIGIVTADCVPILICDRDKRRVLAIHAGWRGLVSDLIPNAIQSVYTDSGIDPSMVSVLIYPAILPASYEVKSDVMDQVNTVVSCYTNLCSLKYMKDSWLLDTQVLACLRLIQSGIHQNNIRVTRLCTFKTPDFHSYRRDGSVTGRNFSFISKNTSV